MTNGTTPTLKWNLKSIPANAVQEAYMTIRTANGRKIERDLSTARIEAYKIIWTLTQEETLLLTPHSRVQMRFVTGTGYAGASPVYDLDVNDILKKGVIG